MGTTNQLPPGVEALSIRIPKRLKARIERAAKAEKRSVTQQVVTALEAFFKKGGTA